MDFSKLKSQRGDFQSLQKHLEEDGKTTYSDDEGFWKLTVDKSKNGFAVIRFLPAPDGEDYPYAKRYSHSFKHPATGKWYIENSLTSIGQQDPCSELNSDLWNNGTEAGKDQARRQKRKLEYISNILVIQDSAHPENEGKTFKYKYGARIFQKIEGALNPEFEDEKPFNPFCFWEGADFKLKARQLDGQRSYDKSAFEDPSALFDGDENALKTMYEALPSLQAELAPEKFKSYDKLKARLDLVFGTGAAQARREVLGEERENAQNSDTGPRREAPEKESDGESGSDEDTEALARYRALLADED